jgi:gluconolactonase
VQRSKDPARELSYQGIFRCTPDGTVTLLSRELSRPNGLGFSPDERTLYVSQSDRADPIWRAFDVRPDGSLGSSRVLFDSSPLAKNHPGLPDGLKLDTEGNLYASGPGGILVLTPEGTHLGTILTGRATSNCAFGDDGHSLYITAHTYLMRVRLHARGEGS